MNNHHIHSRLDLVFFRIFPGHEHLSEQTASADVEGWDSLRHVVLISEIEKEFGIEFSLEDMLSMKTYGDIIKAVKARL